MIFTVTCDNESVEMDVIQLLHWCHDNLDLNDSIDVLDHTFDDVGDSIEVSGCTITRIS